MPEAPTIYEVARAAGVSIATVSRALTDASKLRPETRERVLQVVAELGYVPSGLAQGMARRRTGVLGIAFPDLADPSVDEGHETLLYYDAVLRGVERAARRDGYAVLIAATEGVEDRDFDVSLAGKTDGMVVLARTVSPPVLERLARRVPVVLCAGPREPERLDHVGVANSEGTAAVTRHLIEVHGHRELAFLGGPADSPDGAFDRDVGVGGCGLLVGSARADCAAAWGAGRMSARRLRKPGRCERTSARPTRSPSPSPDDDRIPGRRWSAPPRSRGRSSGRHGVTGRMRSGLTLPTLTAVGALAAGLARRPERPPRRHGHDRGPGAHRPPALRISPATPTLRPSRAAPPANLATTRAGRRPRALRGSWR